VSLQTLVQILPQVVKFSMLTATRRPGLGESLLIRDDSQTRLEAFPAASQFGRAIAPRSAEGRRIDR
jgi:hypothetical protein